MLVKFNKYERTAGLFVFAALIGSLAAGVGVAIKRGWLETKIHYITTFNSATGIHAGTIVQINGLRAGTVDSVELNKDNSILVNFYIAGKFQERIREDSKVVLVRPFVIGDKILDLSVGTDTAKHLAEHSTIPSEEALDLMDLVSGRKLGPYMESFMKLAENFKVLADAFLDPKRTNSLIRIFDRMDPLVGNLNLASVEFMKFSNQMTYQDNLKKMVAQMAITSEQMNRFLPELGEKSPEMIKNMDSLVRNLTLLSESFQVVMPALAEVAPELPKTTRRAVEAIDEAVITLKAMQRSYFLRSAAEDIRREERLEERKRAPAGGTSH